MACCTLLSFLRSRTRPLPCPCPPRRRRQKENQEDLLQRVNQATLDMLNKGGGAAGGGGGQGRRITDIVAYKSPSDMQHNNSLTVQVDHRSECVLVPIYGVLVPFHILTVKNASNNQVQAGVGQVAVGRFYPGSSAHCWVLGGGQQWDEASMAQPHVPGVMAALPCDQNQGCRTLRRRSHCCSIDDTHPCPPPSTLCRTASTRTSASTSTLAGRTSRA